jgi:hypothetical protein
MSVKTSKTDRSPIGGRLSALVALLAAGLAVAAGCTDAELYSPTRAKAQADRVTLSGRVCTEDPVQSRFPVRVVLMADRAAGPLFSDYDPAGRRVQALRTFAQRTLNIPKTAVSVIGYGGRPAKLAPTDGNFTRNPGELFGALNQLAIAQPCLAEDQCRDYREALRSARALIEGDIAGMPAGARLLTQYVVVMVNAGPQRPTTDPAECCAPDDVQCQQKADNASGGELRQLSRRCARQLATQQVSALKQSVRQSGAGGLRFHSIHLAANTDHVSNGKNIDNNLQQTMESMAFAGEGIYRRIDNVGGLREKPLDLLGLRTVLHAKLLLASNHNALPTPDGPKTDSDGDGLSDQKERQEGTSPTAADTDADGITDRVELLVGFDATTPNDPKACQKIEAGGDLDLDRLTNCDEALLGTKPSLVDTDGDGLPDPLEVHYGTDYLNRDADEDVDGDGVDNGEEIRRHTDPRSTDTQAHLSFGYRYDVTDQGFVTDLFAGDPDQITGVEILDISDGTTPGVGTLRWLATEGQLRWKDATDDAFGPPVDVDQPGRLQLPSSSFAPVQGDEGKRITVDVEPEAMPPRPQTESIRVTSRRRQCLDYTIRNVKMMPTEQLDDGTEAGYNDIVLYFAQAPEGNFRRPGPYRRAQIPVRFNPPDRRTPGEAILEVQNREFVRPDITIESGR